MSFRLKLRHAEACLERLEASIERRKETHPNRITVEKNPQTDEHIIRLHVASVLDEWRLDMGDVLFNLRASLDHLVYELAIKGKGGPLSAAEAKRSEFPIYGERSPTPAELQRQIGCVDPGAQAVIVGLQPHATPNYRDDCLWILNTLNNIDKHRALSVVATTLAGCDITLFGQGEVVKKLVPPPEGLHIEDGTEVARFIPKESMHVKTDFAIAYSFREPELTPAVIPIDQGLRHLLRYVEIKVVAPLEPFL